MKVMGQIYAWSTEYYGGVAHYEYIEPFRRSESLEISPDFFNFEASIPEEVSGNQIRLIVSGEEMTETDITAVQQMRCVNNLEVIVTLNDFGSIFSTPLIKKHRNTGNFWHFTTDKKPMKRFVLKNNPHIGFFLSTNRDAQFNR